MMRDKTAKKNRIKLTHSNELLRSASLLRCLSVDTVNDVAVMFIRHHYIVVASQISIYFPHLFI